MSVDIDELIAFWKGATPERIAAFGLAPSSVRMTADGVQMLIAEIDRLRAGGSTDPDDLATMFIRRYRERGLSWQGVRAKFGVVIEEAEAATKGAAK